MAGVYYSEALGISKDPYLEIIYGPPEVNQPPVISAVSISLASENNSRTNRAPSPIYF